MQIWTTDRKGDAWKKRLLKSLSMTHAARSLRDAIAKCLRMRIRRGRTTSEWLVLSQIEEALLTRTYTLFFAPTKNPRQDAYALAKMVLDLMESSTNPPALTWVYTGDPNIISGPAR